jgi:hypothetical protein
LSLEAGEDPLAAPGLQSAQKLNPPSLLRHWLPWPGGSAL